MRALITGARGQDGTLLSALLHSQGWEVLGIDRPGRASELSMNATTYTLDLKDELAVRRLFSEFLPDQVYHLAACHHSSEHASSAPMDREMVDTNFLAAAILIASIAEYRPDCRILLAGSSQMYRMTEKGQTIIDEDTPMNPASFYGRTKAWSRELLAHYRERFGVFGSMAILFNHESSLRSPKFVTRKISMAAARAKLGQDPKLELQDISAQTDWSSAADIVEGMRLALNAPKALDYVLASGVPRRVEDVLEVAFQSVGLDWKQYTTPASPNSLRHRALIGDPSRARTSLGWQPTVTFDRMIRDMVAYDIAFLRAGGAN